MVELDKENAPGGRKEDHRGRTCRWRGGFVLIEAVYSSQTTFLNILFGGNRLMILTFAAASS